MVYDMDFSTDMIVNVDLNAGALLFLIGILVMAFRTTAFKDIRSKLLMNLIIMATVSAVSGLILSFIAWPQFSDLKLLVDILDMILEVAINLQIIIVFFYVLYEIFKSEDYVKRKFSKYKIPVAIMVLIPVINIFTGFFWYYDENNNMNYSYTYLAYNILRYVFLFAAVIMYFRFKSKEKNAQRFNIWLLLIPMFMGTLAEGFTGYSAWILGAAIGYNNLYMLVANEMGYRDHETGFFNRNYISQLYALVDNGAYKLSSIISYQLSDENSAARFADAIRAVLPDECDTIRTDAGKFITVSESSDRGYVYMLSEDVSMMAEDAGLEVTVDSVTRGKNDLPADFFIDNIRLKR